MIMSNDWVIYRPMPSSSALEYIKSNIVVCDLCPRVHELSAACLCDVRFLQLSLECCFPLYQCVL